ncbi:MAG: hypothetical protein JRG96_07865 [Deltaproteobacteria bacterium]|nr:hypothetical protein [Deltaproteobacteria bacterium]MBW2419557.1 hypothetical protein [Deltaproteobacteria bacterium]
MTLPVSPDVDTILESCIETLRKVVVPEAQTEWARYSGELLIGSLEYARGLLDDDRNAGRREDLARAIDGIRASVERSEQAEWPAALSGDSPFVVASQLLVTAQNAPGPLAEEVKSALHPLLYAQLDAEMAHSMPLFIPFARNMSGVK